MTRFVALDVETANPDRASICAIGVAVFEGGGLVDEWYSLVDPEDVFNNVNVRIHGIRAEDVGEAPNFGDLSKDLNRRLDGEIVVTHTAFDRVALSRASALYRVSEPDCVWLDSARVTRRVWEECAWSGYGLGDVCAVIGHKFRHHDALEDAKAAGYVLLAAMEKTGLNLEGIQELARARIGGSARPGKKPPIGQEGNPEGPLWGEVVVFTGSLSVSRRRAATSAAEAGCAVKQGVTRETTILVVGGADRSRLANYGMSAKRRKVLKMVEEGYEIRILREEDFWAMVRE